MSELNLPVCVEAMTFGQNIQEVCRPDCAVVPLVLQTVKRKKKNSSYGVSCVYFGVNCPGHGSKNMLAVRV